MGRPLTEADLEGLELGDRCAVPGCERKRAARGWCLAHYQRWLRDGVVQPARPFRVSSYEGQLCADCGAHRPLARGYCNTCYRRRQRRGER